MVAQGINDGGIEVSLSLSLHPRNTAQFGRESLWPLSGIVTDMLDLTEGQVECIGNLLKGDLLRLDDGFRYRTSLCGENCLLQVGNIGTAHMPFQVAGGITAHLLEQVVGQLAIVVVARQLDASDAACLGGLVEVEQFEDGFLGFRARIECVVFQLFKAHGGVLLLLVMVGLQG